MKHIRERYQIHLDSINCIYAYVRVVVSDSDADKTAGCFTKRAIRKPCKIINVTANSP